MQRFALKKIYWFTLLLTLTACPVPDVDEYAELTREMTEAVKTSASEVIYFLDQGLSDRPEEATEIDPLLLEDLANLQGRTPEPKPVNYSRELERNWETIFSTLDALVAYSDALAGIKDSGGKGKESFNALANALDNIVSVSGIPFSETIVQAGGSIYDVIAQIKAKNQLQHVITNADLVVQHIAAKLDSALYYMKNVNDAAKSKNLLKKPDSEEAQQINQLYKSLVKKQKANRKKIILLNDYDNGDYESLKFFIYEDPLSLNKLGIKDLTDQINNIYATGGLTPSDCLEQVATLARSTFKANIDNKLTNSNIVRTIDIDTRRAQIHQELTFIRAELDIIAPQYHKNIEDQQQIEAVAEINEQLIDHSGDLIRSWSKCHSQMKHFLAKKQKLSFNEIKLYINEIKALKEELGRR